MSYGMDGWNHDNDLVRRKDVMDSIVREYNQKRTGDGLKLAWIEKAVNDVPFAQPTQNTRVNSNNALDTISRKAAIDAIDVLCQEHRYKIPGKVETYSQYNEAWQDALDRAEGAIFNLPFVRPEIVRCKNCKHNQLPSTSGNADCEIYYGMTNQDGFCHMAERRTDDQT